MYYHSKEHIEVIGSVYSNPKCVTRKDYRTLLLFLYSVIDKEDKIVVYNDGTHRYLTNKNFMEIIKQSLPDEESNESIYYLRIYINQSHSKYTYIYFLDIQKYQGR